MIKVSMTDSTTPTAAVLVIGNEILSGRTQDANLNYIAKKLAERGIRLLEARVVADIEQDIVDSLNALRKRYTYIFTTGGIGPTHDDITADSIAKAFGVVAKEHPEARARLAKHYVNPQNLTEARLRMARIPEGATLVENPVSLAPGFKIDNVYVMAGVPNIMQAMLDNILPTLTPGPAIHVRTVTGFVAESLIANDLGKVAGDYPALDIGSYPWVRNQRWGTSLVVRGTDERAVTEATALILAFMKTHDTESTLE